MIEETIVLNILIGIALGVVLSLALILLDDLLKRRKLARDKAAFDQSWAEEMEACAKRQRTMPHQLPEEGEDFIYELPDSPAPAPGPRSAS